MGRKCLIFCHGLWFLGHVASAWVCNWQVFFLKMLNLSFVTNQKQKCMCAKQFHCSLSHNQSIGVPFCNIQANDLGIPELAWKQFASLVAVTWWGQKTKLQMNCLVHRIIAMAIFRVRPRTGMPHLFQHKKCGVGLIDERGWLVTLQWWHPWTHLIFLCKKRFLNHISTHALAHCMTLLNQNEQQRVTMLLILPIVEIQSIYHVNSALWAPNQWNRMHCDSRMDGMGCSKTEFKGGSSLADELLSNYCYCSENSFSLIRSASYSGALGSHFVQHTPAGQPMLLKQFVGHLHSLLEWSAPDVSDLSDK